MNNQKGYIAGTELLILIVIVIICVIVPLFCHQDISRKQKIFSQNNIQMSYWDIFWTSPKIVLNQGKITIINDKENK